MGQRVNRPGGPRATLADVAERAGVSTATVSRFLSHPALVGTVRADRVRAAIDDLGYRPHGAARALASRRTGAIGAIVPTLDGAIFAAVLQALQQRVVAAGMTLMVGSSDFDPVQEREQVNNLVVRGLDGIMLTGAARDPAVYATLAACGVRHINAYVHRPGSPHPSVGFDNAGAMRRLVGYLHDLGHRRFGMIAGIQAGNDRAEARVAGTRAGLAARGLGLAPQHLVECPYTIGDGRVAMRRLMTGAGRPTAVLCGNDVLALGALFEAQALGLAVPGAVSVTGFDDLEITREITPRLTTVHAPVETMGRLAAEYLVGPAEDHPAAPHFEAAADLVVRDSTAPPPVTVTEHG